MSEIFAKVKSIIMDKLGSDDEEVNLESNLIEDLGADSLDVLELVVEIEKEFDIQIPDNIAEEITTVSQIVEYVEKHI